MENKHYLYNFNYHEYEMSLCAIELRTLFGEDMSEKVFISKVMEDPSVSSYLKNRLEISVQADSFEELLMGIETDEDLVFGRRIEYLQLMSDDPYVGQKKDYYRKIAECLYKRTDEVVSQEYYTKVSDLYGITFYKGKWYFGSLLKNNNKWLAHNSRPYSYSISLKINMAKVLVNIAGQGDRSRKLLDPLCGAGTVLLEAAFAGYDIVGSDINQRIVWHCLDNLAHFGYDVEVDSKAIESIHETYDGVILDLPYDLFTASSKEEQQDIIHHGKRLAKRVVIISSKDISEMLAQESIKVIDSCIVRKNLKRDFARYIWVCEGHAI